MLAETNAMLVGGIAIASLAVSFFFLRYWRSSRDRFFLFFAFSFALEAANRVITYHVVGTDEDAPGYYLVRLVAYGVIVAAIIDKNRSSRVKP
ncbi:MAG TPA: DUF5985 family protein [Usitatibacter sp.]|jgi:hypothetical protein|nr:DUF5985 family protein [Usitatibacter sp.]